MSFNKPLHRNPPRIPSRIMTPADKIYRQLVLEGFDPKQAAKRAQAETGLSVVTGQKMKSRGYGWQGNLYK